MRKTINPCALKEQYEVFKKQRQIKDARLENFKGPDGIDCYNPSIPFMLGGKEYILCRTQHRQGTYSKVYFFTNQGGVWKIAEDAPTFDFEDPAVTTIGGKTVVSGVNVRFGDGINTFTEWKTDFYVGTGLNDFRYLASGPDHMKDIRLVELKDGRVGVFTRPLGKDVTDGHIAKIGFVIIDKLEDLTAEVIKTAPLFSDFFLKDEWGGCNYACLLKNGLLGVIGHKSYRSKENGEDRLHYYGTAFVLNPETREVTDMSVIISRDCFPHCEPREERLSDITFTAGIVRNGDGTARIYTGLSDSAVGSAIIKDPFVEYENIIID